MKSIKAKDHAINLTSRGAIIDEDGDLDLQFVFADLLFDLSNGNYGRNQMFVILVSKVGFHDRDFEVPYRYTKERRLAYRTLLKRWKTFYMKEFSSDLYAKITGRRLTEKAALEKDGERRSGWGQYSAICQIHAAIEDERKFNKKIEHLSPDEKNKAKENRRRQQAQEGTMLFVG